MNDKTAEYINILGRFCGKRDVPALDHDSLSGRYQIDKADVMVLFGGSILAGGDVLARAIRDEIASCYIIVGGAGHTTESLRQRVHSEYSAIETAGLPEAEIFQRYLREVYGCKADLLETRATNCGNNITNLLELLDREQIRYGNIILCQDATMRRTGWTLPSVNTGRMSVLLTMLLTRLWYNGVVTGWPFRRRSTACGIWTGM